MKEITLEVITPSKKAYSGIIKSLTLPGTLGSFQVLFNHAPIISTLEIGKIKIIEAENDRELVFAIGGGTAEVNINKILILAESFESPEEIDIKRAESSLKRAKDRLKKNKLEKIDLTRAEASLNRALNRIKVAGIIKS